MFRYLYKDKNPIAGLVKRQYMHFKWEEQGYISALLARTRVKRLQEVSDPLGNAYEDVNLMEIEEHYELAKSDHVEQSFKMFSALNKATLGESDIILNRRYEELSKITAIIDPDKFPIFSLIETLDKHDLVSIWEFKKNDIMKKVVKQLGFQLEVKPSTLEHHLAGDGTFLKTEEGTEKAFTGQLLGFLGGVAYESLSEFSNSRQGESPPDSYIHRFDNTVIDFSQDIPYPFTYGMSLREYFLTMETRKESDKLHIKEVPSHFINPYSQGHKINHPPKFSSPNVIFLDIYIPEHFFQESLMRFFPYIRADQPAQESIIQRKSKQDNEIFT